MNNLKFGSKSYYSNIHQYIWSGRFKSFILSFLQNQKFLTYAYARMSEIYHRNNYETAQNNNH